MLGRIRKLSASALFIAAFASLWPAAFILAPLEPNYRFFYGAALFLIFALTYYVPVKGLFALLFILPWAAAPSGYLEIGAHQPVIFFSLFFALGYWANRLVTGKSSGLPNCLKFPLLLLFMIGLSSAFWTISRYGGLFHGYVTPFFYDRAVNTDGVLASTAVRVTLFQCLLFLTFPALFWSVTSILGNIRAEEKARTLKNLWKTVMVGLWPVIILAFLQHRGLFSPGAFTSQAWLKEGRVSGGMSDPNALGLFCALSLPLTLWFCWKGRLLERLFFGATALAAFVVMTYSGSRSSLLFIFLSVFIFLFFALNKYRKGHNFTKKQYLAACGAFLLLLALLATLPTIKLDTNSKNPVVRRIARQIRRHGAEKGVTMVDRRDLQWKQALRIWKEYPLEGVGVGAFPLEVVNYNREAGDETPMDNPWNQYLTWGVELGVVGVAVWFWFIALLVYKGLKREKDPFFALLISALLAFMVISFFGTHLNAPEVAVITAVLSSFFASGFCDPESGPLRARHLLFALLFLIFFNAVYAFAVFGKLGTEERRARFDLSGDFGLFRRERWLGNAFYYRWTAPKGGILVEVPEGKRIIKLRLAAVREEKVSVSFWYAGELLDTITLDDPQWREVELDLFPWLPNKGLLCFEVSNPWKTEDDERALGFALADDYEFTDVFERQVQGLVGYENTQHGRLVVMENGLSWHPDKNSTMVHLDFEMIMRKPFEPKEQTYELYLNGEFLETFKAPLDGQTHTLETALPGEKRNVLSLRALKLFDYKIQGQKEKRKTGGRVRAIGDF